jgi:hypothetical protein
MNKVFRIFLLTTCLFAAGHTVAQDSKKNVDTSFSKTYVDSLKKLQLETVKMYADSLKKVTKNIPEVKVDPKWAELRPVVNLIIVIAFFVVMLVLFIYFFSYLKRNNQRIGFQSIKLIGLILIFPGICILAIVGGESILSGQTLAVLLGTIAGYVLSRDDDAKDTTKDVNKTKDEADKAEANLKEKIKALEDKIKSIKDKNPGLVES